MFIAVLPAGFVEIDAAIAIVCASMYCYEPEATRHFRTQQTRAVGVSRIGRD
jgi:hypothetical protein